jgi:hypothetical protein
MFVWLYGLPIPPSLNHAYPTRRNGRRCKSLELRNWQADVMEWALLNRQQLIK